MLLREVFQAALCDGTSNKTYSPFEGRQRSRPGARAGRLGASTQAVSILKHPPRPEGRCPHRWGTLRRTVLAASIFLSLQLWPLAQEKEESKEVKNPLGKDKAAIAAGREIYGSTCAACHGTTGQGGRGPRLADAVRGVRDMSDKKVFDVIKEGVKGTQMPPFSLPDTQIWQMVSFIRSLNATAIDEDIPGNVAAGEALFFGSGKCSECHMIHGHGGLIGPDLSNLGVERSAKKIEEALKDPSATIVPGFAWVSVVTRDGRSISGVAKNNSHHSIQILDLKGNFNFFLKRDLKEVVHYKKSLMPQPSLSDRELQDLLAFLSRQSMAPPPEPAKKIEHGKENAP